MAGAEERVNPKGLRVDRTEGMEHADRILSDVTKCGRCH